MGALDEEAWHRLLAALDPDEARAALRYQALHRKLADLFRWRRLPAPEDLADETFDRAARRLAEGEVLAGDVARYLSGVAHLVALEAGRRAAREVTREVPREGIEPPPPDDPADGERRLACLDRCLAELPEPSRRLLLRYQHESGGARIRIRKALAEELAIPLNALRIRVHRLRERVEACVRACLASDVTSEGPPTHGSG